MRSVSQVQGMSGTKNAGRLSGIWPMSPTVRISKPSTITATVSTTMATSAEGTARVIRGSR